MSLELKSDCLGGEMTYCHCTYGTALRLREMARSDGRQTIDRSGQVAGRVTVAVDAFGQVAILPGCDKYPSQGLKKVTVAEMRAALTGKRQGCPGSGDTIPRDVFFFHRDI